MCVLFMESVIEVDSANHSEKSSVTTSFDRNDLENVLPTVYSGRDEYGMFPCGESWFFGKADELVCIFDIGRKCPSPNNNVPEHVVRLVPHQPFRSTAVDLRSTVCCLSAQVRIAK